MPITGEIVQAGEILLMMVRGIYWVVDDPLARAGASGAAQARVMRSVLTTERARPFGSRSDPFRWVSWE